MHTFASTVALLIITSLAVKSHGQDFAISTSECGFAKGCFRGPGKCKQPDCTYLVTYMTNFENDTIEFEISGKVKGDGSYFTMGIGLTPTMDNVYTIGCFVNGSVVTVRDGITPAMPHRGHSFAEPANIGVNVTGTSFKDSILSCRFSRDRQVGDNKFAKDFSQNQTYYLLAAAGPQTHETGFGYHEIGRWFTQGKVAFNSFDGSYAGGPSLLLRLHGSLMLVAWMAIGIIGILLALHYRITISKTELLGSRSWLKLHRVLQITAVVFTAASFVLVFVAVNELHIGEGVAAAHPILGIIIMSLALLNGIVIFSRRLVSIDHTKLREAVSTSHMVMGRALYILSAANIILGLLLDSMQLDMWTVYTVAGLIGATVVVEIALYAHSQHVENHNKTLREGLLSSTQPETSSTTPLNNEIMEYKSLKNNSFRIGLLVAYTVVAVGVVGAIIGAISGLIPSSSTEA